MSRNREVKTKKLRVWSIHVEKLLIYRARKKKNNT